MHLLEPLRKGRFFLCSRQKCREHAFFASQLLRTQLFIFGLNIRCMNIWHKRFLYLQILLLVIIAVLQWFYPINVAIVAVSYLFLFVEFGTLEAQRKENPNAVLYQKSCVFALVDLFTVFLFLIFLANIVFHFFIYNEKINCLLFLYIACRKFYILKHYSYIK